MTENEISNRVIGCAIAVHKALGPGLLESAYEECLAAEMDEQGLTYDRQRPVPVTYKRVRLDSDIESTLLWKRNLLWI
jgi:GxxExxY protein